MGTSDGRSWIAREAAFLDLKVIAEPNVFSLEPDRSFDLADTGSIDCSLSSLRPEKERIGLTVGSLPDLARDHHDDLDWLGGRMLGGMGGGVRRSVGVSALEGAASSPGVCSKAVSA